MTNEKIFSDAIENWANLPETELDDLRWRVNLARDLETDGSPRLLCVECLILLKDLTTRAPDPQTRQQLLEESERVLAEIQRRNLEIGSNREPPAKRPRVEPTLSHLVKFAFLLDSRIFSPWENEALLRASRQFPEYTYQRVHKIKEACPELLRFSVDQIHERLKVTGRRFKEESARMNLQNNT